MNQATIFYSGTVQGIGFRYTVHRLATNLELKGWVKNLADGRVQLVVEGEKPVIEQLCERIKDQFDGYIANEAIDIEEAKGSYKDFQIIY